MTPDTADQQHGHLGMKVAAIIDDALAELFLLGCDNADCAAELMACQAAIRINDNEKMKGVETFVGSLVWDYDDTGGGK